MREELIDRHERRKEMFGDLLPRLAIQPHQIEASIAPQGPTAGFVEHEVPSPFAGRSYRIWRNDPSIAKMVNDTLAERTEKGA